jgi:hypothetical protein
MAKTTLLQDVGSAAKSAGKAVGQTALSALFPSVYSAVSKDAQSAIGTRDEDENDDNPLVASINKLTNETNAQNTILAQSIEAKYQQNAVLQKIYQKLDQKGLGSGPATSSDGGGGMDPSSLLDLLDYLPKGFAAPLLWSVASAYGISKIAKLDPLDESNASPEARAGLVASIEDANKYQTWGEWLNPFNKPSDEEIARRKSAAEGGQQVAGAPMSAGDAAYPEEEGPVGDEEINFTSDELIYNSQQMEITAGEVEIDAESLKKLNEGSTRPPGGAAPGGAPGTAPPAAPGPGGQAPTITGNIATLKTRAGKSYQVAKEYAGNFQGFVSELESSGYQIKAIGGYRPSAMWHGKAMAIDINPDDNPMFKMDAQGIPRHWATNADARQYKNPKYPFGYGKDNLPDGIAAMAAKYGLGWGGNWKSSVDTMHFSMGRNEGGNPSLMMPPQYAEGSDYVPNTGPAIVGEEGPELIMGKDGVRMSGPSAHMTVLNQGDTVVPAGQTKKITDQMMKNVQNEYGYNTPEVLEAISKGQLGSVDPAHQKIFSNLQRMMKEDSGLGETGGLYTGMSESEKALAETGIDWSAMSDSQRDQFNKERYLAREHAKNTGTQYSGGELINRRMLGAETSIGLEERGGKSARVSPEQAALAASSRRAADQYEWRNVLEEKQRLYEQQKKAAEEARVKGTLKPLVPQFAKGTKSAQKVEAPKQEESSMLGTAFSALKFGAGFVPVAGQVISGAETAYHLSQGNAKEAMKSSLGMIPGGAAVQAATGVAGAAIDQLVPSSPPQRESAPAPKPKQKSEAKARAAAAPSAKPQKQSQSSVEMLGQMAAATN